MPFIEPAYIATFRNGLLKKKPMTFCDPAPSVPEDAKLTGCPARLVSAKPVQAHMSQAITLTLEKKLPWWGHRAPVRFFLPIATCCVSSARITISVMKAMDVRNPMSNWPA